MNKLMTYVAFIFSLILLSGCSDHDQQAQHHDHEHAVDADAEKKTHQDIIK
jgi:PBP1b-binding outer membrane lipoprotein LpoB